MRFIYIDRVTEIESGKRICGVKTFPLSEAYLKGHYSKAPLIPGSILIEAMSQITGWLVVYTYRCEIFCAISMIRNARLPTDLRAGAMVELHGELVDTSKNWSQCRAWVKREGKEIASAERLLFPHFKEKSPDETIQSYRNVGWIEPQWDWEVS